MPVRLNGSSSGFVELAAPAAAGSTTLELPTDSIKPGLVLVAQESLSGSTVSVDSVFSAEYDNYLLMAEYYASAIAGLTLRMRLSGTDNTSNEYVRQRIVAANTSLTAAREQANLYYLTSMTNERNSFCLNIFSPAIARNTTFASHSLFAASRADMHLTTGTHNVATAYDGFSLFATAGTFTGSLSVFGYRSTL